MTCRRGKFGVRKPNQCTKKRLSRVKLCTNVSLHGEVQTFNCMNRKKEHICDRRGIYIYRFPSISGSKSIFSFMYLTKFHCKRSLQNSEESTSLFQLTEHTYTRFICFKLITQFVVFLNFLFSDHF